MNVVLSKEEVKNKILEHIMYYDYQMGCVYFRPYIRLVDNYVEDNIEKFKFKVESNRTMDYYDCNVTVNRIENNITHLSCSCDNFKKIQSCQHLAACLLNYSNDIFKVVVNDKIRENVTKDIFNSISNNIVKTGIVKKEVKLEIYLEGTNFYEHQIDNLTLVLKIGIDKLYLCKERKIRNFLEAYSNGVPFEFSKKFVYDPDYHYFNQEDEKVLNYLNLFSNYQQNSYYSTKLIFTKNCISGLFNLIKNRPFYLNNYLIREIRTDFPFNTTLLKKDDKYRLKINLSDNIKPITNDLEYVQVENRLYQLDSKNIELLSNILMYEMEELVFDNNYKDDFTKKVLPTIKKNITLDDSVDDIKISKELVYKLYFDLYHDKVICNLKLLYDDVLIDYFEKNNVVLRENDKENIVIDDLYQLGFIIDNESIYLDDIDDIGYFFEEGLASLCSKYEVYTSEKIKSVNIVKKNNVKSTFSIGTDNILSYSFDLGDIKDNEIVNILESIKNKKNYYKLTSGDLIDLRNNDELKELESLVNEMDLSKNDLINGRGIIPKYRAIYLDSLKDEKYHIIETNNLFDNLIDNFKKYKDSKISLTDSEKKILRSYQVDGVKWLYNIDKTGFGGILADEMGLGKSIQTIYYIKELLKENKDYKFLIVSPTSLAYNWKNEFDKFGSSLKYKVITGLRNKRRESLLEDDTNIYITTYGLLKEDKEYYDQIEFKTMIIDEAQNIKNVNAEISKVVKEIKATTKLALTGTPIENSLLELWSIFDYIMPGFMTNLKNFEKVYKINNLDEEANNKLTRLNKLVSPFIMRRRKKDVIKDLPDKIENNIYVDLTKEQKQIYLAELEKVKNEMDGILATEGMNKARFLILTLLTRLRQICIDPRIIYDGYHGGSGKIEEFINVVKEQVSNGHKILIFTSFKTALNLVEDELKKEGITSYVIDGSVSSKKRMELVDNFNNDNTNVFLIMLKAGGTGLNLTAADVVIHLDLWWNPQAENQATDRAHRIGQKNVVSVIKFISKGTIEEKILDLQIKKKVLSDKLLDENSQGNIFNKLTEKDIKHLLSYDEENE